MDYPFDRPIRNHYEATLATQSAYWWPAHTVAAIHPIGDRLIEIVTFRAANLWQDTEGARLGVLTVESFLITLRHDPMLLAPAPSFSNFFPGLFQMRRFYALPQQEVVWEIEIIALHGRKFYYVSESTTSTKRYGFSRKLFPIICRM